MKQKGVNLVKKVAALAMREDALLCAEVSSEDRMALPPDPPPPPEPRPPNPPILEELDCRDTRRRRNATVARAFSFACQPKNNAEKKRTLQGGFINSADDDNLVLVSCNGGQGGTALCEGVVILLADRLRTAVHGRSQQSQQPSLYTRV